MKTNEMNLQEMQQTNGGAGMPPVPENSGSGDITVKHVGPAVPNDGTSSDATMFDGRMPQMPGMDQGGLVM
jgi:hypothetical protein